MEKHRITYCEIKPKNIPNIKDHRLIIAYHPLGGGGEGWDSYEENLSINHNKRNLANELKICAKKYAKDLSKKTKLELVDLVGR